MASAAVLGTALLSQYWGGLAPCELCLLQRWPWWAAIAIAAVALSLGDRSPPAVAAAILALVFVISIGLAAYHFGVEQHWIAGPAACTAPSGGAATLEDLRRQILGQGVVMCDRPAWTLFGVSLAGWNALASLIMAGVCLRALRQACAAPGMA